MSYKAQMNGGGESHSGIVPTKRSNEGRGGPKEIVEGRPLTKENMEEPNSCRTPGRESEPSGLDRVRQAAKKDKEVRFTALLHHVNLDQLRSSYNSLKKRAAAGVDGMTWEAYGEDLEARLADLHGRLHRGAYRAKPSRRVWIPKADGRQRPLGIAALEDKIIQHAVGAVLNQIWEEDFLGFSYGFREGRSQHDALDALYVGITQKKVNWILDLDVKSFFDKVGHDWMIQFVEHRIADPRIVRLIQKWLKAGVMEGGRWFETEEGTPQGSVKTPRTQKITSSLSGGWNFGGSRVRIDSCRIRLYVYDRWHAPAMLRKQSDSIARANCCCMSISSPMRSTSWRGTAPYRPVKPIATSNKLSG
jgi:RNA-directed DNA polymerase